MAATKFDWTDQRGATQTLTLDLALDQWMGEWFQAISEHVSMSGAVREVTVLADPLHQVRAVYRYESDVDQLQALLRDARAGVVFTVTPDTDYAWSTVEVEIINQGAVEFEAGGRLPYVTGSFVMRRMDGGLIPKDGGIAPRRSTLTITGYPPIVSTS